MRRALAIIAVTFMAGAIWPNPAASTERFSSNPITVIIPFTAGASADATMRLITQQITDSTRQRFVIRNMPGGGGVVGAQAAIRAAPNGLTLFQLVVGTHLATQRVTNPPPFDIQKDFEPVTVLWNIPLFLVVPATMKASNVAELVALARSTKNGLSYASPTINGASHFLGEIFSRETSTPMLHIPYLGASPAMTDLVTGRVDFYFVSYASVISFVTSGRLRLLAVASETRLPLLKEVPTMIESGYPAVTMDTKFGLVAPAGTPAPIVAQLHELFVAAVKDPDVARKAEAHGVELMHNSPADFRTMIAAEFKKIDEVLKSRPETASR